jgi:hypothetical protein
VPIVLKSGSLNVLGTLKACPGIAFPLLYGDKTYLLYFSFIHRGADKSLARPTSRFILFDGENISFDVSLIIYINSTNIPPIMIINTICGNKNLLAL